MQNDLSLRDRILKLVWVMTLSISILSIFAQATKAAAPSQEEPKDVKVPKKLLKKLKSFEPSALIYLQDSRQYLLASDDTTEDDQAMLFLMDSEGSVNKEPVLFNGVSKMTDIESISEENGYIYTLGSMSRNKKGKDLIERNLLVKSQLQNGELQSSEPLNLRTILLQGLELSSDPRVQGLKRNLNQLLEAEASFVRGGHLFVGLKDPQPRPGVAMILDLGLVDSLLHKQASEVKVAFELDLGRNHKLSDMIVSENQLFVSSTIEEGGGAVWNLDAASGKLKSLSSYDDLKPEGLAAGERARELLVVFDQGTKNAKYTRVQF